MLIEILRHTPPWVWGVLAVLLGLGVMQLRPRDVPAWQPGVLPLVLFALGLSTLWPLLHAHAWSALPWVAGLALSAGFGWRLGAPAGARWNAASQRLHRPGSVVPLGVMLAVFLLKYAAGVGTALAPEVARQPAAVAALALMSGVLGGWFSGRSAALLALVWRERRPTMPAQHAHRA